MKAIKQIIVRLSVSCVCALGLVANLQAESYHSAKDPDLVPLPFNPHPELETVEISPGIFIYDDTGIPDTQQQIISRKIRKAAAERAKQIASDPVLAKAEQEKQQAAQQAAYAVQYKNEFAPWNVKEVLMPDGSQLTAERMQSHTESNLLSLASANSAAYAQCRIRSAANGSECLHPNEQHWDHDKPLV